MPENLAATLKAAKSQQAADKLSLGAAYEGSGYVLVDEAGRPLLCGSCGTELSEKAKFCSEYGAAVYVGRKTCGVQAGHGAVRRCGYSSRRYVRASAIMDSVSLVLMLPVSLVLMLPAVLVRMVMVPVPGVVVVPVFAVLPLVAHLAGFPQSVKPVRSKNRPVPCGLCRNS